MEVDQNMLSNIVKRVKDKVGQNELAGFVDLTMGREYAETVLAILEDYPELVKKVECMKERINEERAKIDSLNKEIEELKNTSVKYDEVKQNG